MILTLPQGVRNLKQHIKAFIVFYSHFEACEV